MTGRTVNKGDKLLTVQEVSCITRRRTIRLLQRRTDNRRRPLPRLTAKRAHKLRSLWVLNLETCHVRIRRAVVTPDMMTPGGSSMFGRILTRLWSWVVGPILRRLNLVRTVY